MIKSANLAKEIVVSEKNKVGLLADMARLLAEAGINIDAVAGYAAGNEAKIMLVSVDISRAKETLRKAGYKSIQENEVIMVSLENKPGALKLITEKLAVQAIDIKQIYGTTCPRGCPAKIILTTIDNARALAALKK